MDKDFLTLTEIVGKTGLSRNTITSAIKKHNLYTTTGMPMRVRWSQLVKLLPIKQVPDGYIKREEAQDKYNLSSYMLRIYSERYKIKSKNVRDKGTGRSSVYYPIEEIESALRKEGVKYEVE